MELKQKFAKIKEKLNEHSDVIVFTTLTVSAVASLGLAHRYKNTLLAERESHRVCHGYAQWVVAKISDGEPRLIQMEGDMTYIKPLDTTE